MQIIRRMSSAAISKLKDVDIDAKGVFKYILLKVKVPTADGKLEDKTIVRGYAECPFHTDINNKVISELETLKSQKIIQDFGSTVLGGGKIQHDPDKKTINVYGESTGYGKADHQLAVAILKKAYPNYNITFSEPSSK
ncbi:unnamed protein product [Psylliodes chrysocephalus]|uniref:Sex-regulated protein janus-A n=1 Tax=Psylliodes chrysocephalus TaxID=3402493 RepID=A0A9P0CJ44_9CUCU|nr:unnamed protein product [Psylliodes chrysocephala]